MALAERRVPVQDGELLFTLEDDGSLFVETPKGSILMTTWLVREFFAEELDDFLPTADGVRLFHELDALRPTPEGALLPQTERGGQVDGGNSKS